MSTPSTSKPFARYERLCLALIGIQLLWLGVVMLRWMRGEPPSYHRQYETRLLMTVSQVAMMSAVLVGQRISFTPLRVLLLRLWLGGALAAMIAGFVMGL